MNVKRICISFTLFAGLMLSNCVKDDATPLATSETNIDLFAEDEVPMICTELEVKHPARAFGNVRAFWQKSTLRVRFLGGSSYVRGKVMQYAREWSEHAHITFEFVDSEPSDIRISFDSDSGSWSYVGRNNQYIPSHRATMNFGWFNNRTRESEFRRTTLHEFGHALGLSHEHQHPEVNIAWNRPAVYDYYRRTQDWTRSEVDGNIFRKYSASNSNFSSYDPASIMHYYIPRSLVSGVWNPTWNTRLSTNDINFIGQVYPKGSTEELASCTCPQDLSILACEDFESHTQQSLDEAPQWIKWSDRAGSAELQTYTWGKVIKMQYAVVNNPDVVYIPEILTEGQVMLQWKMYVGTGHSAYFNVQKFKVPGQEFGVQCYFETDENGRLEINGRSIEFQYQQGTWNQILLSMNFDDDWMTLSVNGAEVAGWPASWRARSSAGTAQFAGINFYAVDQQSRFWLDDFCLSEPATLAAGRQSMPMALTDHPATISLKGK